MNGRSEREYEDNRKDMSMSNERYCVAVRNKGHHKFYIFTFSCPLAEAMSIYLDAIKDGRDDAMLLMHRPVTVETMLTGLIADPLTPEEVLDMNPEEDTCGNCDYAEESTDLVGFLTCKKADTEWGRDVRKSATACTLYGRKRNELSKMLEQAEIDGRDELLGLDRKD